MTAGVPIRWRITLWYVALLSVTLALFGAGFYVGLRALLYDNFQEQVRQQASIVVAGLDIANGTARVDPATIADFQDEERFLRVMAADGSVLADTSAFANIPASRLQSLDPITAETSDAVVSVGSSHFGVATVPIRTGGITIGAVQVGIDRGDIDEALQTVGVVLVLAAPVVLGAAIIGGYVFSRRILAPVVTISDLAAELQASELGTRLNLQLPDDELGRLARTFDAMLARIEDAFERQRQFTGDAAHELRTPLSLMRSQVDVTLTRERTNPEYRQALQDVGTDLERLTALVNTLLALARADSGQLHIDREQIDLVAVLSPLLAAYAPLALDAGITLIDESVSTIVLADEDLLVQMLVNLVDNALTHTPSGGTITIGCGERDRRSCLWVVDTGTGIAREHQTHVFERFYRVDAGRTRERGGVGLGLAFCKAIADAHGGTITVASRIGKGSRFEFCFPVTPPSPRSTHEIQVSASR